MSASVRGVVPETRPAPPPYPQVTAHVTDLPHSGHLPPHSGLAPPAPPAPPPAQPPGRRRRRAHPARSACSSAPVRESGGDAVPAPYWLHSRRPRLLPVL